MTNKDTQILALWNGLTDKEKNEVFNRIKKKTMRKKRHLRPIWQYLIDLVKACLMLAVMYVLIVGLMLLA